MEDKESSFAQQHFGPPKPKEIIIIISESLLKEFSKLGLIDKYNIYQHLMTYWAKIMQDDVYLIAQSGWKAEINTIKNNKGKLATFIIAPKQPEISLVLFMRIL